MSKLTPKQEQFCLEYMKDLNATKAAERSGYSMKTAMKTGSENLQKPEIQRRINELKTKRAARLEISSDNVLQELISLSKSDIRQVFDEDGNLKPMDQWPDAIAACVASVEVEELFEWEGEGDNKKKVSIGFTKKVKFWDKTKALDMIGRHLKLFGDDDGRKGPAVILVENGKLFTGI